MADDTIATITVRNYRCFGERGATFELRPGFTAFVGPNNAGKSILLRVLRELRNVIHGVADQSILNAWLRGQSPAIPLIDTEDSPEIVSRGTRTPVIVDIRLATFANNEVARIQLQFKRETGAWSAAVYQGQLNQPVAPSNSGIGGLVFKDVHGQNVAAPRENISKIGQIAARSIYIGPFRHAHAAGGMEYGDITVGSSFIAQWHDWQTGASIDNKEKLQRVENDVGKLFSIASFRAVAATATNTLQVRIEGRDYDLREVGSGLAQCLIILGNVAFKDPSFILIDEPELGLHPSLQVDFLGTLSAYAEYGVIFATHSLGLARTVANNHYIVYREDGQSMCRPWQSAPNITQVLGEMSYGAYRELGNDLVLCVEGPNDVMPARQFLRLLGKEHTTVVIHLGGDNVGHAGTPEMIAELQRVTGGRVAILLDSERTVAGGPAKANRNLLVQECPRLGVSIHLTDRRAFENYFSDSAVKSAMGSGYRALTEFEKLSDANPRWNKHDNWRIAGDMTRAELMATDVGQFLDGL